MKELTIKKETLDVVRQMVADGQVSQEVAEKYFPELRESEDERIRKALKEYFINSFQNNGVAAICGVHIMDILAWFEKQGEQKSILNIPSRDVILSIWDLGNEWKELTNGSISTEYGTQLDYIQKHWHESEYYLKEKQGEQKSIDKVEPKFKVGDWVVSPNGVYWHIDTIRDGRYQVSSDSGEGAEWPLDTNIYHRFTIQDAKGGDVLIDKSKGREGIFIFKKTEPSNIKTSALNPLTVLGYCGIGGAGFTKGSGWGDTANCTYYPATKEQRDFLFTKIKEAGYMWNKEKKELKRIEQKLVEEKELLLKDLEWIDMETNECHCYNCELFDRKNNVCKCIDLCKNPKHAYKGFYIK